MISASVTHDGMWFVIGGQGNTSSGTSWEMFTPENNKWTMMPASGVTFGYEIKGCIIRMNK